MRDHQTPADAVPATASGSVRPQTYIEETPQWRDGTAVDSSVLTGMQWRIWWLASAGKFFEGMVVFMTGIALPLIGREFGLSALEHGLVSSAVLFGILIGATALGGLADRFGRRIMFIVEMALFILFLLLLAAAPSLSITLLALFGIGLALGCDYPTAHMVISENIPARARGKMVLGAFGVQAIGAT
ncbi:MFS transporter [Roseibium sediminicola]|uniref:MFS transporter n=1 Tax=Roseibium sediminicola TaxID=2933272 RepID=UPI00249DC352|nr:MFS transporter [Roseibium sp. CAU 1639]